MVASTLFTEKKNKIKQKSIWNEILGLKKFELASNYIGKVSE